jgi:hypothetical protein
MRDTLSKEQIGNYLSTKRFESTQLYVKPGRIENESLLADR